MGGVALRRVCGGAGRCMALQHVGIPCPPPPPPPHTHSPPLPPPCAAPAAEGASASAAAAAAATAVAAAPRGNGIATPPAGESGPGGALSDAEAFAPADSDADEQWADALSRRGSSVYAASVSSACE